MLGSFINTLNRFSEGPSETEEREFSPQELISWATGCMWGGLPEEFYLALMQIKIVDGNKKTHYKCILNKGGAIEDFYPGDMLYPIICAERLDDYLPEDKKNWVKCVMRFDPKNVWLWYEYDEGENYYFDK